MTSSKFQQALAALFIGGMLLSSCGNASNTPTSTPSSMLGTDSAATKVGGTAPAMPAGTGNAAGTPAGGAGQPTTPTGH